MLNYDVNAAIKETVITSFKEVFKEEYAADCLVTDCNIFVANTNTELVSNYISFPEINTGPSYKVEAAKNIKDGYVIYLKY